MNIPDWILLAAGAMVAIPIAVVVLEIMAALLHSSPPPQEGTRPRLAVVIPAHDEQALIAKTLAALMPQLVTGDWVIVVADNCTDATAALARAAGAEVVERQNRSQLGKGYALAAAVSHLAGDPPEVLIILDADTIPAEYCIAILAREAFRNQAPVQGLYQMMLPAGASARLRISALAFEFKNHLRALGAHRLGIPCLLRGTGMAFPWQQVNTSVLATDNLVEDMQLGIDLACAGKMPRFCPAARVSGCLPAGTAAAAVQRTRWEHGHLQTILRNTPRLFWLGTTRFRPGLIGLALDLAVPPLALLALYWCVLTFAAVLLWCGNVASLAPLLVLLAAGVLLAVSMVAGWSKFARHLLPMRALLSIPVYMIWKLPLYFTFLWKRQRTWIRTERAS